jgi:hypothetical protein
MAAAAVRLADSAFTDALAVVTGAVALVVLLRFRPNTIWLVAGGALVGVGRILAG